MPGQRVEIAAIKAVETVDSCVGEIVDAVLKRADAKGSKLVLDDPSRAHLEDVAARIDAILDADVVTTQP